VELAQKEHIMMKLSYQTLNKMLSKSNIRCHGISLLNTTFIVVFTVLPTVFGIILKMLFSELNNFEIFYSRGEFFLYTVSLCASAFISYYSVSPSKKLFDGWLRNLLILLMVIVSGCYAFIIASNSLPRASIVKVLSYIVLPISILLFYWSQYLVNKKSPDITELRTAEQEGIEEKLA
jgi:hypothetical protein